jgi:hypothetical protein
MAAVLLPSVVALHSSVEHAVKAIYEQISVTLSTLYLLLLTLYPAHIKISYDGRVLRMLIN